MRSRLCRAAALALTGWYLMGPPIVGNSKQDEQRGLTAPLAYWHRFDAYDSVDACKKEAARINILGAREKSAPNDQLNKHHSFATAAQARAWAAMMSYADCIASDDPRLTDRR